MSSSHLPIVNRLKFMLLILQLLTERNLSMHLKFFLHWTKLVKCFRKRINMGKQPVVLNVYWYISPPSLQKKSDQFCVKSRSLLILCASFILVSFIFQPGNNGLHIYICVCVCVCVSQISKWNLSSCYRNYGMNLTNEGCTCSDMYIKVLMT